MARSGPGGYDLQTCRLPGVHGASGGCGRLNQGEPWTPDSTRLRKPRPRAQPGLTSGRVAGEGWGWDAQAREPEVVENGRVLTSTLRNQLAGQWGTQGGNWKHEAFFLGRTSLVWTATIVRLD